ncbi:hypothetical protein G6K87_26005 (plasmid) [Agrobacterium tumefaciens]|uniref:Uncharacterized protein n=2 Tax=Agrobacterium tumefaciens complex TaxID=1183400 RepID=A0A2Z2PXY3_9HYPH|nr:MULTISPECIES: hypothetical protein [Agrobacterium tumefaciens complex]ASK43489.1 hypothetical protein [Agrobacterium radiobacter]ASK44053.1 hypothetical protein [Agrobacterium fabrum]ASK46425.1 hypothetical protein [Agrobacterium fabrum]NSY04771.1 hypothetical protein [Agrobacterium tumefaciens]QEG98040.1 hypothetical protein AgrTiT37_00077 [Agrobacterium tumefaciens]
MLPNVIFSDPFDPQKRNATRDFMQQVLRGISGAAEVTLFSYKFEDYALATSLAHASRAGARVRMLAHDSLEFRDENEIASQLQCFAELEAAGVEIIRTFSPPNYACAQHVKLLMVADDRGVQVISPAQNFADHLEEHFCELLHFVDPATYEYCLDRWLYCVDLATRSRFEITHWFPGPALNGTISSLTFMPTEGGSLVANWLSEIKPKSRLLISMPRWTENGSETLRQIIEASEREVRVSVVINSEKTHPIIKNGLECSSVEIFEYHGGISRYLVELGENTTRLLRPTVNFNGFREKHHDLAFATSDVGLTMQFSEHWQNMRRHLA